jgi:pimeloyl-ACP methyl ester carboxylesterase
MYPAGQPRLRTRYVTLPDGVTMRLVTGGPEQSERAVVLLHGWAACLYTFAELLPALVEAGHTVVAVDLPGFGLSDKPRDERKYATRYQSEAVEVMAAQLGIRRYALVAHSMGGAIALHQAVRSATALERLVLVNPVGLGTAPVVRALRLLSPRVVDVVTPHLITRALVRTVLRLAFVAPGRPTERDVDEYWAPSQFDGYAAACRASLHAADWSAVPADLLAAIRVPTLVIVGDRDRLIRGSAARAPLIPAARIVNVADGGHIVLQECSDRTNEEITRFLAGR